MPVKRGRAAGAWRAALHEDQLSVKRFSTPNDAENCV